MKERFLAVMGFVVIAALGITLHSPARSQTPPPNREIVVFSTDAGFLKEVDVAAKGFSAGDYNVGSDPLLDPETGEKVGTEVFKLSFVRLFQKQNDVLFIGDFKVSLPEGTLAVYGAARFSEIQNGATFAVVGGTGDYAQVRGSVVIKSGEVAGQSGRFLTFDLTTE